MGAIARTGYEAGFFPDGALVSNAAALAANWSRTSGWVGSPVEGRLSTSVAQSNNAVFAFTATGALYGGFYGYFGSLTNQDILTFDNVVLRIVSTTQIAIRVGGVNVATAAISAASLSTWYGIRFKVVLGTGTSDISFEWNGTTTVVYTGATANNTATGLTIGPPSGRIDDFILNDGTGSVDNGIPAVIPSFQILKAGSAGATSNWAAGGLATVPSWFPGSSAQWAYIPSTSQYGYLDTIRQRIWKLDNTGALVDSYAMAAADTNAANLCTCEEDDIIAYFALTAKAIVDMSGGTAYTGSAIGTTNGLANYVKVGSNFFRLTSNTVLQKFSSAFVFTSNITISGTAGTSMYLAYLAGLLWCPPSATNLPTVNPGTSAVTNITIASGGVTYGWVYKSSANKVYNINATNTYVLNSASPALLATVANGFTPANGPGQNGRWGKNQANIVAFDSSSGNFFVVANDGSIWKYDTTTDTYAAFGSAPSGSNGEWGVIVNAGKLYANAKSGVRIYDIATGALLASLVFPVATATYARMWFDGTYIAATCGNEVALVDVTTNALVVASSKVTASRGITNGASAVTSYLYGDAASTARQDLQVQSLVGSPSNIEGVNIIVGRAYKSAIGSGTLTLGLQCSDGTDLPAGSPATLTTTPADVQRSLLYKSGTTKLTPADMATAKMYVQANP